MRSLPAVCLLVSLTLLYGCGGLQTSNFLPSGIYTDSPDEGTPHYFIALNHWSDDTLSGDMAYMHEGGQTELAFTFTATQQSGVATLTTQEGK